MELSPAPPDAAAAAAAAADPPPFSGPATPSASSMLSKRISWGSGGSSSWAPRMLRPAATHKQAQRVSDIRGHKVIVFKAHDQTDQIGTGWFVKCKQDFVVCSRAAFSPCRYELGASCLWVFCRACLCLFSFIYTLRCTLCALKGWHDSNIHKLTNAQRWSGTSTLRKDAKQKTIPRVSVSDFDTEGDAGNSKKWLLLLICICSESYTILQSGLCAKTKRWKKKCAGGIRNESVLCSFHHEFFISFWLCCLFPPVCQQVVITQPIACMHTLIPSDAITGTTGNKQTKITHCGSELQQKQAWAVHSHKWIKMWLNGQ